MAFTNLVVLSSGTCGQQGELLGSDEKEIVLLVTVIIDTTTNKVVAVHRQTVRPENEDQQLSEACKELTGIDEEQLQSSPCLQPALQQIDHFLRLNITQTECNGTGSSLPPNFCFVSDGQLHMRQVLHPEACNKNIDLPPYLFSFFDLRKNFKSFYNSEEVPSVNAMLEYLSIPPDSSSDQVTRDAQDMTKIVQKLIQDGHCFDEPEIVSNRLEPGICGKNEEVESSCVVRARGLPWQSSDQDIARFFRGLNVAKGGVALCLSPQGRRNGEALVRFINQEHRDMALKRHKHHIGQRYIEVYKASGEDFVNVAGGNNNEAQTFLSRGGQVIVRMRGLPYDCSAKQVVDFFNSGENCCAVMDGEEGVLFVKKPDGRATGDAFVMFETEDDALKALGKHREIIGSRYIELFRITNAEVQQVLKQSQDPRTYEPQSPLIQTLPAQMPLIPQPFITSGTRKDCIRLRGLPYEAQVEHILEFLGDHSKMIVFQGVHMVYNAQGQPSGEAFIQMDSEHSAFVSAQQRHHKYMIFGKKQRYIEVFQVSGEDMNLVLTGGIPQQRQPIVSPAGGTILSTPYGPVYSYGTVPHAAPQMIPTLSPLAPRGPATANPYYPSLFYWPYPSPPVSPTTGYYSHTAATSPATPALLSPECLQLQRNGDIRQNNDALIAYQLARNDAERAIQEKNRQNVGNRYVELFMS